MKKGSDATGTLSQPEKACQPSAPAKEPLLALTAG
jgi:hypothetical protein